MDAATLGWVDYLVILAMMCVSVGIGFYYRFSGGHQKTLKEYFSANKSMSTIPVGIALMISFISAIALLGISGDNYTYGTQYVVFCLPMIIATPIICYGYFPVFYKLQATSVNEYLSKRFGEGARLATSSIYGLQLLLYAGVCLYAPALALEVTTGLPRIWSVVAIGIVCACYSSLGGMKAVLITDLYQGFLMLVAVVIVITTAAINVGGLSEIWRIAGEGGRVVLDNVSVDPTERYTWWNLMINGLATHLSLNGVNQVQVQRLTTLRNIESARMAMVLNTILYILFITAVAFSGLAIYSQYYDCDPRAAGRITSNDMLMPLYIMDTLSHIPGLPGLFIAGIFSAALSTISAALNSLAAMSLEDYVKPLYAKWSKKEISESTSIMFGKVLALTYGFICIAIAFAAQLIGSILQTSLSITGIIGGPSLGIFTLGMFSETANQTGAVTGLLSSLILMMWIAFGQPRPQSPVLPVSTEGCEFNVSSNVVKYHFNISNGLDTIIRKDNSNEDLDYFYLYRISYMWYSTIGFLMTFVLGLAVSYLSRIICANEEKQLDPDLFFPVVANRIRRRRQRDSEADHNAMTKNTMDTSIAH